MIALTIEFVTKQYKPVIKLASGSLKKISIFHKSVIYTAIEMWQTVALANICVGSTTQEIIVNNKITQVWSFK